MKTRRENIQGGCIRLKITEADVVWNMNLNEEDKIVTAGPKCNFTTQKNYF